MKKSIRTLQLATLCLGTLLVYTFSPTSLTADEGFDDGGGFGTSYSEDDFQNPDESSSPQRAEAGMGDGNFNSTPPMSPPPQDPYGTFEAEDEGDGTGFFDPGAEGGPVSYDEGDGGPFYSDPGLNNAPQAFDDPIGSTGPVDDMGGGGAGYGDDEESGMSPMSDNMMSDSVNATSMDPLMENNGMNMNMGNGDGDADPDSFASFEDNNSDFSFDE